MCKKYDLLHIDFEYVQTLNIASKYVQKLCKNVLLSIYGFYMLKNEYILS